MMGPGNPNQESKLPDLIRKTRSQTNSKNQTAAIGVEMATRKALHNLAPDIIRTMIIAVKDAPIIKKVNGSMGETETPSAKPLYP